ncbi:MAG: ABC transporter ATP-binding protein [Gammaproteobacteria bacterium]
MNSYIKLNNVSLDFPLYEGLDLSFRNKITNFGKLGLMKTRGNLERKIVRGLDSINLDIKKGDRIAIIGPNGSGKTTLLKLLAGIYTPTAGKIDVFGKVSSMIDLGFGFVDDATGYENIILSKVIRGESIKDKESIMQTAQEFTGLDEYLDLPMRTYSSGMKSRLALASALFSIPDILLIDEFFSTGDLEFSKKSRNKIMEIMDNSSIMLFASHDLELIKKLCTKAIYMKNGKISYYGEIEKAREIYEKDFS